MILPALNSYYERLANDPDAGIAPFGFSRQRVSFRVILESDGQLHAIEPLGQKDGTRYAPELHVLPGDGARSGSAPKPFMLWDNALYVFGIAPAGRTDKWALERFKAFRERHLEVEEKIDDSGFSAVCRFLENWNPKDSRADASILGTYYGIFRLRGEIENIHERKRFVDWWRSDMDTRALSSESTRVQCLVTGDYAPVAGSHTPKIKGIADKPGKPSEKFLVAVDKDFKSAESFGRNGNLNSPVSVRAAFQYCTALNRLLAPDSKQRILIGDASTVFWTERASGAENFLGIVFDPPTEDEALATEVRSILSRVAGGEYPPELGKASTAFYVLGLSPNAARISVRFWLESTLEELIKNLRQHFVDFRIDRSERDPEFPAVWQILRHAVREAKDIPPLLGGAVMRAVLMGTPYPSMLLTSMIRRIRADREISYVRAAAIKACLNRNTRFKIDPLEKELTMSLDPARPEPTYHIGRLFAELEKAQQDGLPGIKATIKDRYFGAASATPGIIFPRLIRMSQHHLGNLEIGSRTYREKRIQEILGRVDRFPAHLSLRDQGLFAIGYYHQRQDIFTKKPPTDGEDKE